MAKLQKAKTTPFLFFPGKDVVICFLNQKDLLWRICRKAACFSKQVNTAPCLLMCDLLVFQPLMQVGVSFHV